MCYSAQIRADYQVYVRRWGADVSLPDFTEIWLRTGNPGAKAKAPRAMGQAFAQGETPGERRVYEAFLQATAAELAEQQQALDVQAARLAAAELKLVGSSRVDLQACKLEYSIVSPK